MMSNLKSASPTSSARILAGTGFSAKRGAMVLIGDPGRSYCPGEGMQLLATYQVPVTRALEDSEIKRTSVFRFAV